jgi:hypothetical protein
MSRSGAAPCAAVSAPGAPGRAATPVSTPRAAASRKNGAKSRGPSTTEGKARSAKNALKHGMRAQKYVVLPDEDGAEYASLEAALLEELAPEGVLQTLLARRVAVAAWRLERADRLEAEVLEFRSYEGANAGLALIRDGNATRAFDTLMRYRGAAMAEFWRALKTLKALQAEHAAGAQVLEMPPRQPRAPARVVSGPAPNEPERRPLHDYVIPDQAGAGRTLHEPAACWTPNEPDPGRDKGMKQWCSPQEAAPRRGPNEPANP